MKILDLEQGTPEWLAVRAKHFCASEAPAMMGASPYMSRSELLRQKATGDVPDVPEGMQRLFDDGHRAEEAARGLIEADLGEELYPVVGTDDEGRLLASFDGLTMDGETGYEHKLWNEELAAQVRAKELPPAYYWQLEQQILVGGLKRVIFVVSDGTPDKLVQMDYAPVRGRAKQLLAGWKQFEADLKNYQHVEVMPPAVATPTLALPALAIQIQGSISLISNLDIFGAKLKEFIAGIDKNPSDDQAFADAEAAVKVLQTAQDALEAAEQNALGQTASIDEMRRTVGLYRDLARTTRLALEKLVKARKETIREEIRRSGVDAFAQHVAALNTRLGKSYMPAVQVDFSGAMKGKKTIASLRDAVATEVARAKIAANEIADRIGVNLNTLRELAADYAFLFSDAATIVLKEPEDLLALVKLRIAEHRQAEEKRLDEERARIRQEEVAKAQAEAVEKLRLEEVVRKAQEEAEKVAVSASTPCVGILVGVPQTEMRRPSDAEIIAALRQIFDASEDDVIDWLVNMDLHAMSRREFA